MSQDFSDQQQSQQQKVGDIGIQGNYNVVTFSQTQIIQISVDEIKTRPLLETSPYKGLKKFEPEDKDRFFGRDQFLTGLVNDLEHSNLILLLGASGSGKSSVVRAGLIPWLSQKWGTKFVSLTFTPDEDPFESLYGSLLSKYQQSEVKIARRAEANTLTQVVSTLKHPEDYWLILIDQFEELFTISQVEKRNPFIESLVQLIKAKDRAIKIVLTMRADFLDKLGAYPSLSKLLQKQMRLVTDMQRDELWLAIEQPAAKHGVVFEKGLVEEILRDVQGQAGYLPLLQYTLNLLWETERESGSIGDRTLNINHYRALGGVRGALQRHVDHIYAALPQAEQLVAQRIFLKLVGIGGDEELGVEWKPVRRRANQSEFDDELEKTVLIKLINHNLLVSNSPVETQHKQKQIQPSTAQQSTVEIAHETLLTSWTTLNTWIRENRQAIALRNRLNDDVTRWQVNRVEDELWTGSKLEQVLELRKNATFNQVLGGFSETANEFIDASLKVRDRHLRRATLTAVAGITLAVLASTAAFGFLHQRNQAIQRQISALTASSESQLATHNQLEALMASVEAGELQQSVRRSPNDMQISTVAALWQAVYSIQESNRLEGHEGGVWDVAFSPSDGQIIASASDDHTVKLWNFDGTLLTTLEDHTDRVTSVSFSPDGQLIATASLDGTVKLWQRDGTLIREIENSNKRINSISFSPDGQTVAIADVYEIRLRSLDGSLLNTLNETGNGTNRVAFSPDGETIAAASDDNTIKLWRNGEFLTAFSGHSDRVWDVSFSPDGEAIASASQDQTVRIWNLNGQEQQPPLSHSAAVRSVSFSPDSERIAFAGDDGLIRLWSFKDSREITTLQGHDGLVTRVTFSSDGEAIASASLDNTIRLWKLNASENHSILQGHEELVTSVSASPNGQTFASASADGMIKLWNIDGSELYTIQNGAQANSLSFSPDGQTLAVAGGDRTIKLWKLDGTLSNTLETEGDSSWSVSFSPDGKFIAAASSADTNGFVELWSLDGETSLSFQGHQAPVNSVTFSPNRQIASADSKGTVIIWSLDGREQTRLSEPGNSIYSVNFSPDGKTLALATADGTIKLWHLNETEPVSLSGHRDWVNSISFSPDGKTLASASRDGTVKLWSSEGRLLKTLEGNNDSVSSISFSMDGKTLIAGSYDGAVLLWNFDLENLLERGCSWLDDYLQTNINVREETQPICE